MLNKEEIEKALKKMRSFSRIRQDMTVVTAKEMEAVLQYIEQLETKEQKLIEKLEERIKSVEKCYEEMITDIGGIKIINVTGLSKKEKEETLNKRNCLLVQKATYEEILEILKGGKNER